MPLSDERLEEIRKRVDNATSGPWRYKADFRRVIDCFDNTVAGTHCEADYVFIAHSRQDIPALLDEIHRLRSELRTIKMAVGVLNASIGGQK